MQVSVYLLIVPRSAAATGWTVGPGRTPGRVTGSLPLSDVERAVRSTGGAVMLASLTTILGYASLLLAQNRALLLFGVVAVLGEIACLVSAVVLLPAALLALARASRRLRGLHER